MNSRAPLIAGAIGLVLVILVTVLLVLPMNSKVSAANEQLVTAQSEEASLQAQLVALEELKKNAPEYQRQLAANTLLIPNKPDLPGLIRLLKLAADRAGVDFTVLSTGTPAASTEGTYYSITVGLSVSGTFYQLAQYLWELEHLPRALKVTTTTLSPATYPLMTATANATAYSVTGPTTSEPEAVQPSAADQANTAVVDSGAAEAATAGQGVAPE